MAAYGKILYRVSTQRRLRSSPFDDVFIAVTVSHLTCCEKESVPTIGIMHLATVVHNLRCSLLRIERCLLQVAGLDRQLGEFTNFGPDVSVW